MRLSPNGTENPFSGQATLLHSLRCVACPEPKIRPAIMGRSELKPQVHMRRFKPRFNQRDGTRDSALTPNPHATALLFPRESGKWRELAQRGSVHSLRRVATA
jgi:hypothetical protein